MDIAKIPIGRSPPDDINVVVEIPQDSPIKYEIDKQSGALFVDRFLPTAMHYPGNYGFVPHTLSEDGDPLDVLILGPGPVVPGAVVRCRPIGVLDMEDEAGRDHKIIAVPIAAAQSFDPGFGSCHDLPAGLRDQISHFFEHYKDLEPGIKWVKVRGWMGPEEAAAVIVEAIIRAGGEAPKGA
jgi:inorganic pyrophosphatase